MDFEYGHKMDARFSVNGQDGGCLFNGIGKTFWSYSGDLEPFPACGQAGGELDDAIRRYIQSAETVEHGLQHSTCAGGEIGVGAGGGFSHYTEGWTQIGGIAIFEG